MLSKNEILEILFDWNFWDKKPEGIFFRENYEKKLEKYRNSGEIISLIGIRRSGKSTLLKAEILKLLKKVDSKQILFINFEDPRFSNNLNTDLLDKIFETYKIEVNSNKEIYLFLDEIQNIKNWEKWVRVKNELKQATIYITGSSSKLLSKELGTVLTGRTLSIDIYPLSFKEFLSFKGLKIKNKLDLISKKIQILVFLKVYIQYGGFPKVVLLDDIELKKEELRNYFNNILMRDIVARYNLKNFNNLEKLSLFLLSNNTLLYSANSLKNSLKISLESSLNYISYLKESMLMLELPKFDYSLKKQNYSQSKIYSIDTGFVNNLAFKFSRDIGRLLENLVFIELKRRGKEIYYHKGKKECDFVIKEGLDIVSAIQVTQSLEDIDTKKREINGLLSALKTYNLKEGLILTEDEEGEEIIDDKKIIIMPIWKYLLE